MAGNERAGQGVESFEDLMTEVDRLIAEADAGRVDPVVVDYLRRTRERLETLHQRAEADRREAPRFETEGEARLVVNGEPFAVSIQDSSAEGFGVLSPQPVAVDTYARLDLEGDEGPEMYECLVTHCQAEGDEFRLGLDAFSSLRFL